MLLNRWVNDDVLFLWTESTLSHPLTEVRPNSDSAKIGRVKQTMEDGQYSKAAKILASDGLVSVTEESYQENVIQTPSA